MPDCYAMCMLCVAGKNLNTDFMSHTCALITSQSVLKLQPWLEPAGPGQDIKAGTASHCLAGAAHARRQWGRVPGV